MSSSLSFLCGVRGAFRASLALIAASVLLTGCQTTPATATANQDNPEPGRQGEILPGEAQMLPRPYSRGVRVVGHSPVYGRVGNTQLSWIDHCAYVSSAPPAMQNFANTNPETDGVAVIDVSNPRAPRQVRLLQDRGSRIAVETIHAVTARDRKVLVAGAYANGSPMFLPNDPPYLSIYDASDCANPRLMAEYVWPRNVHTVTISPDGRRVYGTDNNPPFSGRGGLHVLDISDLAHPRYVGVFGVTGPDGRSWEFSPHEISISPDERRIYAAVIDSAGGDLNPGMPPGFSPARVSPDAGGVYIIDNSDIVDGRPNPQMRLVGTALRGGWHSVMPANINGVPYLVGGAELVGCPGAIPRIINIADEAHPFIESEFRLVMNHPENCPPRSASPNLTEGIGGAPSATLHFNDVDSAQNTRLGLFNFTVAGMRIADLRDPRNPVEVAYFRPGDMCTGHVRYIPRTGEIWFVCRESGFWVIELAPEARAALRGR